MSYDMFLQQHKQEVGPEQSVATALRHQLKEVQQAKQDAAQVNFVMATLSACCTLGTYVNYESVSALHARHIQHMKPEYRPCKHNALKPCLSQMVPPVFLSAKVSVPRA